LFSHCFESGKGARRHFDFFSRFFTQVGNSFQRIDKKWFLTPFPPSFSSVQLLATLNDDQREVIAGMLAHAFEGGVFETLKALEEFEIEPFLEGYEGSPYHDFIGRVAADQWQWPGNDEP
jgi:hypothetical protein